MLVTIFAFLLLNCVTMVTSQMPKFKAAVYGHAVIMPPNDSKVISRANALANMDKNLAIYAEQAKLAKQQDANILVFPEDGLYGFNFKRETIYPYLERIPDPKLLITPWSPCSDPGRYTNSEVQRSLSCMAKNNSLYIVANMGDIQYCDLKQDKKCPADGRYQYNTNVAFDPDGYLLARYHKYHLYNEVQFDVPDLELVYFNTPFGRFGLMICFDVRFKDPGISLIFTKNVTSIVFSTAWMDSLPHQSALGFHSSFARGLGINLLSANLHLPDLRFHGSGIYGPDGDIKSYYGSSNTSKPALLIADVKVLKTPKPNSNFPKILECAGKCERKTDDKLYKRELKLNSRGAFVPLLLSDIYTFITLDKPFGKLQVSQKNVFCDLEYSMEDIDGKRELFAFGAFDGLHKGKNYFQICALYKCAGASSESCGAVTSTTTTKFTRLSMSAKLQTPFIYPQVVLSNQIGELRLAEADSWTFTGASINTSALFDETVLSAALFGRDFSRDNIPDDNNGNPSFVPQEYLIFLFGVVFPLFIKRILIV